MKTGRRLLMLTGAALLGAGCAHNAAYRESAGEVAVSPAVAANTAVLRVTNARDAEMKMFAVYGGEEHYLGSVFAKRSRDFALDPKLLGMSGVTFTARAIDNSDALNRGPYPLSRGGIVPFAIPKRDVDQPN
jgi:hypothetical protein